MLVLRLFMKNRLSVRQSAQGAASYPHGYFEWSKTGSTKVPHYISLIDGSPLSFQERYLGSMEFPCRRNGRKPILTTQANSLMEQIHERMPVILHRAEHKLCLTAQSTTPLNCSDYITSIESALRVDCYETLPTHLEMMGLS